MEAILPVLMVGAAVGSGLVGGVFFAFSNFVMLALDRLPPAQTVAAMQAINVTVLNPLFFLAFFGTGAVALALAAFAYLGWAGPAGPIAAASGLYLAGSILVTLICNVPLNDQLAAAAADEAPAGRWRHYRARWTFWNHVRTLASLAAATGYTVAVMG